MKMACSSQGSSKSDNNSKNMDKDENCVMPGYSTTDEFIKDGYKTLIEATKNSNSLPQGRDWDFYNTHESFSNLMNSQGDSILQLINDVLKQQGVRGNIKSRDFEEKVELIIETNDIILERVANNLDELAGIRKNPELSVEIQAVSAEFPISGSWNKMNNAKITVAECPSKIPRNLPCSPNSVHLLTAKNIQRPQKFFKDKIDNSKATWQPQIKEKPNNIKPLAIFLERTDDGLDEIFSHPYEFELEHFNPPEHQLKPVSRVLPPKPIAVTPLHFVDTPEALDRLLETLRQHKEFAVDLEHHSYRSFLGFTCLMQISTTEEDFLIDTLALRDKLYILNEVFTKPTILKVFHGAEHDIEWLQHDLSLYVVNMFDTHQAARQLGYPQLSLAYLLRRFCRVDPNKRFQLADWRIRPLPDELKAYARDDTHFLLYIANLLRNELLQFGENVLRQVYTASTQVCKRRYSKPVVNESSHLVLYRKCKKMFDNRQMYALQHLYQWRDAIAREEDESTGYVLPNHMLLQISELLPREMQGILACCNPIPPLVRSNLLELHRIILRAREQSINKPIFFEDSRSRGATQHHTPKINVDNVLNCPHDVGKEEFRDDLPTLLGKVLENRLSKTKQPLPLENRKAKLSIFETPENSEDEKQKKSKINSKMQKLKFLGPYERYKLVKKYLQAEEKKKDEDKQQESQENVDKSKDRTDTERIEALHEHFKALAAASLQVPRVTVSNPSDSLPVDNLTVDNVSPTTIGQPVAKKRKIDDIEDFFETPERNTPTNYIKEQTLTPPKPKRDKNTKKKNKQNMQAVNEQLNPGKNKKKQNKNQQNNKQQNQQNNKQQNQQNNRQQSQQNSRQQNQQNNIQQNQQNNRQQNQQNKVQQRKQQRNNSKSPKRNSDNNSSPKGVKRKLNEEQNDEPSSKRRMENSENDDEGNFRPFDYSGVDFRQFQGGAGSANQPKKVASNFRGKGSRNKKFDNIGKTNMKSGTFRGHGSQRGGRH